MFPSSWLWLFRIVWTSSLIGFYSQLPTLFQVFEGYVDDCRNTDNAWVETTVLNIHLDRTSPLMVDISNMVRTLLLSILFRIPPAVNTESLIDSRHLPLRRWAPTAPFCGRRWAAEPDSAQARESLCGRLPNCTTGSSDCSHAAPAVNVPLCRQVFCCLFVKGWLIMLHWKHLWKKRHFKA